MEFEYADGKGKVGIIASVSRPFCKQCNRIRLTAEGKLRNCLFSLDETDIKPYLRPSINQEAIKGLIQSNIWGKWEGHEINSSRFVKPLRTMHAIGG
jgi:cyclic pyranopterin phosphate synthase